jgi:hypothetical protein
MIDKIVTGGQTGVDQGALRAARAAGIPTGGWAPLGWHTEGPVDPETGKPWPKEVASPWLAGFGLIECPESGFPARTRRNVADSDATLWLGLPDGLGYPVAHDAALGLGKPFLIAFPRITRPPQAAEWVRSGGYRVLNVAGHRESAMPGIGARAEAFLAAVLRQLGDRAGG